MPDIRQAVGALAAGGGIVPGANMYLLSEVREVALTADDLGALEGSMRKCERFG